MFAGRYCGPLRIERHLGCIETMYMELDKRLLLAGRQKMGEDRRDDCSGLEVFEAKGDELFRMTWGVFVDVYDDKFQVRHWLGERVEFSLQQVELTNSCECLFKVGDFAD